MSILVLHGPNLNLLGTREPQQYGRKTLNDINNELQQHATAAKMKLECAQSNNEAELIDCIHNAADKGTQFIIFNPAAFTHTSVALRDALLAVDIPFIEVHLSNIYDREAFRNFSYFSDIAIGVITGFGALSYQLALEAAIKHLKN